MALSQGTLLADRGKGPDEWRGLSVCANRRLVPGENDLATVCPDLVKQWHPAKNGTLAPADLFAGTQRKVWWRCEKGHGYQAAVGARTLNGSGCPYCAGKKVLAGFNDLATWSRRWPPSGTSPSTAR